MSDSTLEPTVSGSRRFWSSLRAFPAWAKSNVPALIASAAVAGLSAYVVNVWIMAVRYDGYVVPGGSGTTGQGNLLQGGLFWALLPMLLMSIVGYRRAVGGSRFWRDVRGLPRALTALIRSDGEAARINLLWGAAAGMTCALIIGPSLGLVMSAGILVAAPTVVGNVMSSTAYRMVNSVVGTVSPTSQLSPESGMLSTAVGLLGGAASLAAGFVLTDTILKLVLALALAAVAFALSSKRSGAPPMPPAAAVVFVLAAAMWSLSELLQASVALADDGGYQECGASWREWWTQCEGADEVRTYAGFGAGAGAVGGGAGAFLGSVVGDAAVRGDLGDSDPALSDYVDQLMSGPEFDDFRTQHPDLVDGPEAFEDYVNWRDEQGLGVPPLPDGWEWSTDDGSAESPDAAGDASTALATDGPDDGESNGGSDATEGPGTDGDAGLADQPTDASAESAPDDDVSQPVTDAPDQQPDGDAAEPDAASGDPAVDDELTNQQSEDTAGMDRDLGDQPQPPGTDQPDEQTDDGEGGQDSEGGEGGDLATDEATDDPDQRERLWPPGVDPDSDAADRADGDVDPDRDGGDRADGDADRDATDRADGHEVDPDRVTEGPDGRPLVDPTTGEPLRVDQDGNVKYGDQWMSPDEAAQRTASDQNWVAEQAAGRQKVEEFQDLLNRYNGTDDPELRQALESALRRQAIEINEDFQAKAELKAQGRTDLTEAYDGRIQDEYGRVNDDFVDRMQKMGLQRGGRDFNTDDVRDIRNAASAGTAGMDRDLALEQQRMNEMLDRLETIEPGTPEAQRLSGEIETARQGIDYEKWLGDKRSQLAEAEPGSRQAAALESDIARIEADAGRIKNAYTSDLQRQLDQARPGSPEAQRLQTELNAAANRVAGSERVGIGQAQAADRVTVDYDKAHAALTRQLGEAPAGSQEAHRIQETLTEIERHSAAVKSDYLDNLRSQLDAAQPGSPDAQRIQTEIDAASTRMAGRSQVEITTQRWNDMSQSAYDGAYRDVTGGDSARAFQGVTQSGNPEAYRDLEVLANDPANRPFAPEWGAQTSDVTGFKADELDRMVDEGLISRASADQEIARGLSKDLGTKLIPEMRADPNIDPVKLDRFERMNEVLVRAGRGEIPPGQVDGALRAAVPEIPGLTLGRATELTVSNLDAATRWQPTAAERAEIAERVGEAPERTGAPEGGSSRLMGTMGTLSDIATTQHYTEQNIERGMDPTEAATVAMVQTGAGNATMASGVVDPRSSMIGQALLPNELRGALPDQAIENYVGTGYQAGSAGLEAVSESLRTGQLDTTAIDDFATSVAEREGTDFFTGYARAADLAGEESARTDGGNVFSDLQQIHETGVGEEMVNQGMEDFEASVARGEHGAPLEGWSHIAQSVAEWTTDPGYEASSLLSDMQNMWEHGVGDDYWSEAVETTTSAIKRTPLIGTVAQGYQEIATGLGESGVTGFASEMAEGAWALAGEGYDAVSDSAGRAADYIWSYF